MAFLNRQINENNQSISGLKKDLAKLKGEYAKMIYYAYKNQDAYSRLMFVFAAKDFEQAFMRLKYLQQYSEYRHKQAEIIINTQKSLNEKIQELEAKKSDKKVLLSSEETEKKNLTSEKNEKEQVQQLILSSISLLNLDMNPLESQMLVDLKCCGII